MSSILSLRVAPVPTFLRRLSVRRYAPGLAVAVGLAVTAEELRRLPGMSVLSPAILAILLGMAARRLIGVQPAWRPGLAIAMRTMLRLGVVLLGLQITLGQIAALGADGLAVVAGGMAACFFGTLWLGRRLGVAPRLTRLIAAGTSVCGASAVVGVNSVTQGSDEEVAYALAAVTLFGTLAMLASPLVGPLLGLDRGATGLWMGASIHEVAQVVGAASQLGDETVRSATVAKMARVLMLAPLVLMLAAFGRGAAKATAQPAAKLPVPWFVFGFLALAGLASLGIVPASVTRQAGVAAGFLLAAALAAMGFGVDPLALRRVGPRPLLLASASWLLIAGVSFGLLQVVGG